MFPPRRHWTLLEEFEKSYVDIVEMQTHWLTLLIDDDDKHDYKTIATECKIVGVNIIVVWIRSEQVIAIGHYRNVVVIDKTSPLQKQWVMSLLKQD